MKDDNVVKNRHLYVGGSDLPTIMGINPFKSRFDLLLEKAELLENDFTGNEYTDYGNKMEPKIRQYINHQGLSKKPFREEFKIDGVFRSNVDGFNGETVLEIKTTGKSGIRVKTTSYKTYLVQLLHYMEQFNVERGILAVYERPTDFNTIFDEKRLQIHYVDINNFKELIEEKNKAIDKFLKDLEKVKENPFITEEELNK